MPDKFYFKAENANRYIAGIVFEPCDVVAGTVLGVFETDDAALAERIAKEIGVEKIEAAEYEDMRKKKAPTLNESVLWNRASAQSKPLPPIKGKVAAVVQNDPVPSIDKPVEIGKPVEKVEDAIQIGQVTPPPADETSTAPVKRFGNKAKAQ